MCRTKVPEFFELSSRISPRILLRISPKFLRSFRASFHGKRRPRKNHQNPHSEFPRISPNFLRSFRASFHGKRRPQKKFTKNLHHFSIRMTALAPPPAAKRSTMYPQGCSLSTKSILGGIISTQKNFSRVVHTPRHKTDTCRKNFLRN